MINTSNEYKSAIRNNNRHFYAYAEIEFADESTVNLDNTKISNIKIDDYAGQPGSFPLGAAIVNKLTLSLNNYDNSLSDYDFTDAVIRPAVGLQLSETIETVPKGVFTAENPKFMGSTIVINAQDNMIKAEKSFKDVSITFPTTAGLLLYAICLHCEIPLKTTSFYNDYYVIQSRPDDETLTCREVISWIAQISGNFARCDNQGRLELKWFDFEAFEHDDADGGYFDGDTPYSSGDSVDGGNFTDYNSGDDLDGGTFTDTESYHMFSTYFGAPSIAIDDVVVTGIQVKDNSDEPATVLFGDTGYVISIEGNGLIQSESDANYIAETVGAKIVGMKFRPLTANIKSDPSIEAGDVGYLPDRYGNYYQTIITNCTYDVRGTTKIACDVKLPLENKSTRYSEATKVYIEARKHVKEKLTAYDLLVKQLNDLVAHSFGVYKSEEVLPDGSVIYYMHDKPTLAESQKIWKQTADAFAVSTDGGQTYTAGFDAEGNAVFNVLAAIGINADWITAGKLLSKDGATLIDLDYGVANSDNLSFTDNIQSGFPLIMPFNIDDNVSKINKVLLKYTQQPFRTYSATTSSGGGGTITSDSFSAGGETGIANLTGTFNTYPADATNGHTHGVPYSLNHSHAFGLPNHAHQVTMSPHSHGINFGIQEQAISNYALDVYVDGVLRIQIENNSENVQGILDLTEWITTTGWHTIEIRSSTLKRVSAQINIKSYIRS